MIYCLAAMEREAEKIQFDNIKVIGMNAIDLPKTTDSDTIINIGYCGSNNLKVSTIIEPDCAINLDSNEKFKIDRIFNFPSYPCYTSSVFVEKAHTDIPCIYDMELAKIAALPHKKLYSLKIVSDNLDEKAFDAYDPDSVWVEINELIKKAIN